MNDVTKSLPYRTNCAVCGQPLTYGTDPRQVVCYLCGKAERAPIYCPAGHYVCDACHALAALRALRQILTVSDENDPSALLEKVMAHPSVAMHGPEHHVIVPAVIAAAVQNSGHQAGAGLVEKAIERSAKVPGGWCGFYGACGAAIGVGIAVSVITTATPLTGKPRTLAMGATSFALAQMLDDQPRCCKKASRIAVRAAVRYLDDYLGISLPHNGFRPCSYTPRNQECPKHQCQFYDRR